SSSTLPPTPCSYFDSWPISFSNKHNSLPLTEKIRSNAFFPFYLRFRLKGSPMIREYIRPLPPRREPRRRREPPHSGGTRAAWFVRDDSWPPLAGSRALRTHAPSRCVGGPGGARVGVL